MRCLFQPYEHTVILFNMDFLVTNAIMISVPGHRLWEFVFKEMRLRAGQTDVLTVVRKRGNVGKRTYYYAVPLFIPHTSLNIYVRNYFFI